MQERVENLNYRVICREALERNAKAIAEYVDVPVIGVLKCDGYGVSIPEAAAAWQKAGVTMFAVSEPGEALTLREADFTEDVLLLAPVADVQTLQAMRENHIILTVHDLDAAQFYAQNAAGVRAHIAVDTGMGRFGVRWTDLEQLKAIYAVEGIAFDGIFSHFAASFEKKYRVTKNQLDRFLQVTNALTDSGICVGMRHIANSCAALRFPQTRLDAVRCGSALVGPPVAPVPVKLESVSEVRAQVVAVKQFQKGDTTGYASICKCRRPTKAVVVAIGHECGFGYTSVPDHFRLWDLASYIRRVVVSYLQRPGVYYNGKKLPLIGRVGTQYTLFDATGVEIAAGDYVTAKITMLFPFGRRVFK